ncbi:MAG: Eco57I restriction-modification methylase domain-containing protein [Deltaproteobacteria bacterium]|nr:Eco57I restriction-modification methylase domain-containing protein [Deltaproteobacteria bacterium]MDQ3295392.1 Eco57I restriction-modification methylase domain-containing protein [Myxococcota bacterium]
MRESERVLGVVYTPPEVARAMVERALGPLVRGKSAAEILALRVCDPAIGEGVFLVEVVRVLAEHLHAAWQAAGNQRAIAEARRAVVPCIAGVDIDTHAVVAARGVLGDADLRVANALALDWSAAWPAVFARGGFDAIVGNPPYIRQEQLADKAALRGYASYDGVADLYVYFVELAHRIARPGGRYCLITPNKWLTAAYGRGLRELLAARGSVEGIVDLARTAVFADADAFPSIVWGTVGVVGAPAIRATRSEADVSVADALDEAGLPHPRERWQGDPWHIDVPADRALIDRLEARWPSLGSVIGRPSRGVVTGFNRAFVIDRATRDALLAAEPTAAPLIRPFVKGRDVRPWLPAQVERWILLIDRGTSLEPLPAIRAHLEGFRAALEPRPATWDAATRWSGRKPGAYRWYELQDPVGELAASRAPRLLYQDIQTGPACCLDDTGLVPDTTVWILPGGERYLLAVLNSALYGWYARRRFAPALNGAVRPKFEYLRALPIATPPDATRAAIAQLVDQRLALEGARRRGEAGTDAVTRELDAAIDDAVLDSYELSAAERARVIAG